MTDLEFKRLAIVTSAYTGVLLTQHFSDVQDYAEEVLGRSVFTHEFASEELTRELREVSKDELLQLWGLGK